MRGRAAWLAVALGAVGALACGGQGDGTAADSTTGEDSPAIDSPLASDFEVVFSGQIDDASALFGLDLESGATERLTEPMEYVGFPVWSPGGNRLVFLGDGTDGVALLELDAASGAVRELIASMSNPAHMSPDGANLLLSIDLRDGGRGLLRQDIESNYIGRIETGSSEDAYARWSPAGGSITFESGRDGNPEIYRHDLTSRDNLRLTDNEVLDEWPSFSPDGRRIAWASGGEDDKNLWIMGADGGNKRQITDGLMFGDAFPEWSPEGDQILLTVQTDDGPVLYLIETVSGDATAIGPGAAPTTR